MRKLLVILGSLVSFCSTSAIKVGTPEHALACKLDFVEFQLDSNTRMTLVYGGANPLLEGFDSHYATVHILQGQALSPIGRAANSIGTSIGHVLVWVWMLVPFDWNPGFISTLWLDWGTSLLLGRQADLFNALKKYDVDLRLTNGGEILRIVSEESMNGRYVVNCDLHLNSSNPRYFRLSSSTLKCYNANRSRRIN